MKDYRLVKNRRAYFDAMYCTHLEHGIHPGCVYLLLPELAARLKWNSEQKLWFAFINGLTQNPITSLVIFNKLPEPTTKLVSFTKWFNSNWEHLQFDTDRRYAKKYTPQAIADYAAKVKAAKSQVKLLTGSFDAAWSVMNTVPSFGRLSTFSYLEYVYLSGFGADCTSLMFEDRAGSRSHRNGMLLLLGMDHLVFDKRLPNGFNGEYPDFLGLCDKLNVAAEKLLSKWALDHAGNFTLESALCAFKNSFFGRRYVGVYADMAWERILWAEDHGHDASVFRTIRQERLPLWLRCEDTKDGLTIKERAAVFPKTGTPYRAEYFL